MASREEFLSRLKKLSDVKRSLLNTLWGRGPQPSSEWIKSTLLLQQTGQKYFDRRLRELRDHEGLDIESQVINGEHCWRLKSTNIEQKLARTYLTESQKAKVFDKSGNSCAACGKKTLGGLRGLQADHRVPLSRGGTEALSNWQALCHECNVAKRRACQGCALDCSECSWAYPEKMGSVITIKIPDHLMVLLKDKNLTDKDVAKLLLATLEDELGN